MNLKLDRPLVVLDFETDAGENKPDPKADRIIEACALKILPNGSQRTMQDLFNPGRPIHPASTKWHGITDNDVANKPSFADLAAEYWSFVEGCDLAGYNIILYDAELFRCELCRAGIPMIDAWHPNIVDAGNIFRKMERRTLAAAVPFYLNRQHDRAHQALADVEATWEVLAAQLDRYPNLPRTVPELAKFCRIT